MSSSSNLPLLYITSKHITQLEFLTTLFKANPIKHNVCITYSNCVLLFISPPSPINKVTLKGSSNGLLLSLTEEVQSPVTLIKYNTYHKTF